MSEDEPSNWAKANAADPDHRYIIGRARCPDCGTLRAFVAHVAVADLRCPKCDTVCVPSCGLDDAGPR